MSKTKQKFKWLANLLFLIASLELLYTGYLIYQDNNRKIYTPVYVNNVAAKFSTQLYFENPKSLPKKIDLFKEHKFSFTIRNLEGKPMIYQYKTFIDTNGDKRILDKNEIALKNNGSKTIEVKYRIFLPLEASQVFVRLLHNHQEINFWIK